MTSATQIRHAVAVARDSHGDVVASPSRTVSHYRLARLADITFWSGRYVRKRHR